MQTGSKRRTKKRERCTGIADERVPCHSSGEPVRERKKPKIELCWVVGKVVVVVIIDILRFVECACRRSRRFYRCSVRGQVSELESFDGEGWRGEGLRTGGKLLLDISGILRFETSTRGQGSVLALFLLTHMVDSLLRIGPSIFPCR